jgi:acetyl esterase/lipase
MFELQNPVNLVLVTVAATLVAMSATAQAPSNPVVPPTGTLVHRDMAYVANGHARQKLDLYLPASGPRPLPLVVAVHGGAWSRNDKADHANTAWLVPILVKAGYAVASLNHRFSQHATFPAQIHDVKAAVRWLRSNASTYGLNPNRFGAWGPSSGGHLITLLGTSAGVRAMDGTLGSADQSTRVQAVVDWYGPTDFLQMDAHRLPNGESHDAHDSPESRLIGGPIQQMREAVTAANPITYVTGDDPPFLIFHGDDDHTVPPHQSALLSDALTTAGVMVQFHTVAGAGHGGPLFQTDEIARMLLGFFDQYLK